MTSSAAQIVLGHTMAGIEESVYSYLNLCLRMAAQYKDECYSYLLSYYESSSIYSLVRDAILAIVLLRYLAPIEHEVLLVGPWKYTKTLVQNASSSAFRKFLTLPLIRKGAEQQLQPVFAKIHSELIVHPDGIPVTRELPSDGWPVDKVIGLSQKLSDTLKRHNWETGHVSGTVYHGGDELLDLQSKMYREFSVANQLHPDCFPALREMEAEVIAMVLSLFNGPPGSCGTSTSGGTESLLLTCLAARERAKAESGFASTGPFEIIAPKTIHAGFDKAAFYFGMRLVHAPVDPETGICDVRQVERLITPNTVLLAGSAPNFPHGIIDDIAGLSKLALKYKLPLHVDACLGSFVVPFVENVPAFDFRVPGVTSISCDTHKYGFAPKGSSIIMYRSKSLRRYQYFTSADWSGGLYASPTLAGSRPGALMAGCWATLMHLGRNGYANEAKQIIQAAQRFRNCIEQSPILNKHLHIIGDPRCSVVAVSGKGVNIYDVADQMSKCGWHMNALQSPPALHFAFTKPSSKQSIVQRLVKDLHNTVEQLASSKNSSEAKSDTKALYGVAGSVNTAHFAERIAEEFVDCLYEL